MTANTDARSAVARTLCASGKFETGEGGCAAICMSMLGSSRPNCSYKEQVHGKLADAILSALPQVREGDGAPFISAIAQERKRFNEGSPTWNAYGHCIAIIEHVAAAPKPTTEDAIPEGMVRWHGGDRAPEDWDGGPVARRALGIVDLPETVTPAFEWRHHPHGRLHDLDIIAYTPKLADPKAAVEAERERGFDLLLLKALLCLSGFAGEGLQIEGFEDPADVYHEIAEAIGMEDADDDDLRAHIKIESRRTTEAVQTAMREMTEYRAANPPVSMRALLERAHSFVSQAKSFDWNEDRCVMVAVHLAEDLRKAIAAWNTRPVHSPMPGREEIALALCISVGDDPDREGPWAEWWQQSAYAKDADAILALFNPALHQAEEPSANTTEPGASGASPRSDELVEATGDGPEFAAAERAAAMYRFDTASDRARAKEMFRIGWHQSASLRQSTPQ